MLWPLFRRLGKTPPEVTPADVMTWAHGIGLSGKVPSSTTVAARIACLSSYYQFLRRMDLVQSNPCDMLERPRSVQAPARGLTASDVRQLPAVVPDTVRGRRDRAILLTLVLTGRRRTEVMSLKAGDISVYGDVRMYRYKGKGGKTGRRELPRPAHEAIRVTLADCGKELARMSPDESLWQPCAGPAGDHIGDVLSAVQQNTSAKPDARRPGCTSFRHSAAKLRRDTGESVEQVSNGSTTAA